MKKLKVGYIGLGKRGSYLLNDFLHPDCTCRMEIVAVCDVYEDRVKEVADRIEAAGFPRPFETTDYREVLKRDDVDTVINMTAWEFHTDIAVASMKAGKNTAIEVGGAYDIADCWKLVDTYEETGSPLFFMENGCYGERPLMVMGMARQGLFGSIVHCAGGYQHDMRQEITDGKEDRHYRLRNYIHRNCDNYPTHGFGPLMKILDINNGNRLLTLTSMASCAKGLHEYIVDKRGEDSPLAKVEFKQGDVVTTMCKCSRGQTITLTLNGCIPTTFSEGLTVRGTKGCFYEDGNMCFLEKDHTEPKRQSDLWGNYEQYLEKYKPEMWKKFKLEGGGHGGLDRLMLIAMAESFIQGKKPPIDVYDAATLMAITPLTEQSIAMGGAPVAVPDFTRGKWHMRQDIEEWEYGLDRVNPLREIY